MKVEYRDTLKLPKGVRTLEYEDKEILELLKNPEKLSLIRQVVNNYLGQKDALVWFRDDFIMGKIHREIKFPPLTKKVVEDGKEINVWVEKPSPYLDRFVQAVVTGSFKHPLFKIDMSQNEEQREAAVYTAMQRMADECGDVDEKGNKVPRIDDDGKPDDNGWLTKSAFAYKLDLDRPARQQPKAKTPPKYAVTNATNIINNKNEAKWLEKFTKGYKTTDGATITPIAFQPFDSVLPKGSPPEAIEATRQQNINNLAWAIVDAEEQRREQLAGKEYA